MGYLFDAGLASEILLRKSFVLFPSHLEDLFECENKPTDESEGADPLLGFERRYLTIGPPGSGARFHVDPFAASAVSLLLHGCKAWAMFSPEVLPPGIRATRCGDRLVHESPPAAWWGKHICLQHIHSGIAGVLPKNGIAFIQHAGDVVFTPSGW